MANEQPFEQFELPERNLTVSCDVQEDENFVVLSVTNSIFGSSIGLSFADVKQIYEKCFPQ